MKKLISLICVLAMVLALAACGSSAPAAATEAPAASTEAPAEDVSADKAAINEFADSAKISSWAVDGVAYCTKSGLVKGNPGKVFAPAGNTTRAELATIIQRIAA
mgnify:CR=1 FL=1